MSKNIFMFPYNADSRSAQRISQALGIKRIRHTNSRFRGRENKTVINWGSSELPEEIAKCTVLNPSEVTAKCSNKLDWFNLVKDNGCEEDIPLFTNDKDVAEEWLEGNGIVVCRTILNSHSGRGIYIASQANEMRNARLYVKYIPKKQEYRVHIFKGEVIAIQRKAFRNGAPRGDNTFRVRNANNGFVFARNEDREIPPCVEETAKKLFHATEGLDFGAVDIIYNEYRDRAYGLEINTAPGLEGSTVDDYVNAISQYLEIDLGE